MDGGDDEARQRCLALLEDVRAGRVDPSSPDAQRQLFVGLRCGWIAQSDANAAADAYWETRSRQVLEEVRAGRRDPKHPESVMFLDWGVAQGCITKKERKEAEKAYEESG